MKNKKLKDQFYENIFKSHKEKEQNQKKEISEMKNNNKTINQLWNKMKKINLLIIIKINLKKIKKDYARNPYHNHFHNIYHQLRRLRRINIWNNKKSYKQIVKSNRRIINQHNNNNYNNYLNIKYDQNKYQKHHHYNHYNYKNQNQNNEFNNNYYKYNDQMNYKYNDQVNNNNKHTNKKSTNKIISKSNKLNKKEVLIAWKLKLELIKSQVLEMKQRNEDTNENDKKEEEKIENLLIKIEKSKDLIEEKKEQILKEKNKINTANIIQMARRRNKIIHQKRFKTKYEYNNPIIIGKKENFFRNDYKLLDDLNNHKNNLQISNQICPLSQPFIKPINNINNIKNKTNQMKLNKDEKNEIKWNSISLNIHSISEQKMKMNKIIYSIIKHYDFPIIIDIQEHWKKKKSEMPNINGYTCIGFKAGHKKFTDRICGGLGSYGRNDWADIIHQRENDNINYLILQCWNMKHAHMNLYIPNPEDIYIEEIDNTQRDLDIDIKSYTKMNMTLTLNGDTNSHCGNATGDYKLDSNGRKLLELVYENNLLIVNTLENKAKTTFHGLWGKKRNDKNELMKLKYKPSVIDLWMIKRNKSLKNPKCVVIDTFLPTDHYAVYGEITKIMNSIKSLPNTNQYYYAPFVVNFKKNNDSEYLEQIANVIVNEFEINKTINELKHYSNNIKDKQILCEMTCNTWNYIFYDILLRNNCLYFTKSPMNYYRERLYQKQHPALRSLLGRMEITINNNNNSETQRLVVRFMETREFIMKYKIKKLAVTLSTDYINDTNKFWKIIKSFNPLEEIPIRTMDGKIIYGKEKKMFEYSNYLNHLYKESSIVTEKEYKKIKTIHKKIIEDSYKYKGEMNNFINKKSIKKALKRKKGKSSGISLYPYELLEKINNINPDIINYIVQILGDTSNVPEIWNKRMVKFLPKVNNVAVLPIEKTRTISISQPIPALAGSCAKDKLFEIIDKFIDPSQYGGKMKQGCEDAIVNLRIIIDYCDWWGLALIVILLDFKKAFDSPIPEVTVIIIKKYYGIDGKLLRWVNNALLYNLLIVKDGYLYSGIEKTKRCIPQGADEAMILWNAYYNPIVKILNKLDKGFIAPKYEIGHEPLFTIKQNEIIDLKNNKNNLVDFKFDKKYGIGINLKELSEEIYKIIQATILFCDDTSLLCHKPSDGQYMILMKGEVSRKVGIELHPEKGMKLVFGKKYLNKYEQNYENYIIDYRNNNKRIIIKDVSDTGAKLLGHKFKVKLGTKIDFQPHIDHLQKSTTGTIMYLNNLGFNKYISRICMKATIFKSLVQSKLQFGSRSFKPNKTQTKQLIKIENSYYKSNLKLYKSTNNVISRIIYGNESIIATWDINILKEWYHLATDLRKVKSNCWNVFLPYYKLRYKEIYKYVKEDENKKTFQSKGWLYDICSTLNKYNLMKYYDINQLPTTKNEWNKIIENDIKNYHWNNDKKIIKESNNLFIESLIEKYKINGYGNKLPKIIDENIVNRNDKIKTLLLRILSNNLPINWKKFQLQACPLCFKKWTNPLLHIFTNCSYLNESDLCATDKRILSLEIIINKTQQIIEENLEEITNLVLKKDERNKMLKKK